MTERITLPGFDDDDNRTLNRLLEQLDAKAERNRLRAAYYDMRHAVKLVGSVIPPQYWRAGIVLGWSGKAVDILGDRCNLDRFVWPDGDLGSLGASEVWDRNWLDARVSEAIISSLIHSVAFLVNTEGDESAGEPRSLIHVKDATNATGDWNERRQGLDNLLSVINRDDDGQVTELALYLDGRTITAVKDSSGWSVDVQEHSWGVPAEALVYKPRTGRPFGSSRISRAVMSYQDMATRSAIRLEAHSDIYAIPDLWLFGADESIFKNADGSQKQSWQIVMGRIKGVPDDPDADDPKLARADMKNVPASDPEPHLKALKQQAMFFSGETSIPLSSLGVSDMANPTSAESYIASREDLIALAERATDVWSPALKRSYLRALAIQGGLSEIPQEWATVAPKWRSPLYLSRAAQADAGTKQLSAIPWLAETEVGLELLGLDRQQIDRALADRRRALAQQRTAMLAAAAQAARQDPAVVALGGGGGDAG